MKKTPDAIDVHVGSRVRLRRLIAGLSQEKLGTQLGLTFQQVQKYEKGTNRIGAGRLFTIAQILDVPIQFFFDDLPEMTEQSAPQPGGALRESAQTEYLMDFVCSAEGVQLNVAFAKVSNPLARRRLIELIKTLSEQP